MTQQDTQPPAETLATVITISVRSDGSTSFHSSIPPGQNWLDTLAAMHYGFAEFQRQFEESHKCPAKPSALTRRAGGDEAPLAGIQYNKDGQPSLDYPIGRAGGDAIPAGMKPWHGGDSAPADWDGGPVLLRDGTSIDRGYGKAKWFHASPGSNMALYDAIAYTPKRPAGGDAGAVERLAIACRDMLAQAFDYYKARNGRVCTIQGDDGEKCWIVPFDAFEDVRRAVAALALPAPVVEGKPGE